ncbi:hypothetical protein BST61_g3316 [Cercospora zeina]
MEQTRESRERHNQDILPEWLFRLPREIRDIIYSFGMPSFQLIDPVTNRFGAQGNVPNAHKDDLEALFDVDEDSADPVIHERWDVGTLQLRPASTFGLTPSL